MYSTTGARVEPELCWSGAGIWNGLVVWTCGISGLLAHRLWYRNWTIKAYLITAVLSEAAVIAGLIVTLYAITTKNIHYNNVQW